MKGEGHRGEAVLAIVIVADAGPVFAVGDRAFADVVAEELVGPGDGWFEFRVVNATLQCQDQRDKAGKAGLVDRAIGRDGAVQLAIVAGAEQGVPPRAVDALTASDAGGVGPNGRQDSLVAGGQVILGQEQVVAGEAPGVHAAGG